MISASLDYLHSPFFAATFQPLAINSFHYTGFHVSRALSWFHADRPLSPASIESSTLDLVVRIV